MSDVAWRMRSRCGLRSLSIAETTATIQASAPRTRSGGPAAMQAMARLSSGKPSVRRHGADFSRVSFAGPW